MDLADPTVRPRAIRLLEYLKAVRNLREQPVRDVADYRDKRWWAGDIPDHPSCTVSATGAEPWLRVSKAQVPPPPPPPEAIAEHLAAGVSDPFREPAFPDDFDDFDAASGDGDAQAAGAGQAAAGAAVRAAELKAALRDYVEGPWRAWAPGARVALKARELYEDLFELRMRLQRESTLTEIVWGHAVLSWSADGARILHPLVTTEVRLSFDPDTGTISVEPEALAAHHMDVDLLQGLRLSGFDLLVDVREAFRDAPVGPFDPGARGLYEKLLAPLGQDAEITEGQLPPAPGPAPRIAATWILMVRRRSTLYWRFFSELSDALVAGQLDVPAPLVAIVADEPAKLDLASPASADGTASADGENDADGSWSRAAGRLLMPLPTNPEQEDVARRLAEHRGVTVQGPPGTGKTHTIANLISHLAGHGKRVLVTSQKEQALAVLRDKIPASIRDLSVAVLGSSSSSLAQLDQSVQAIYENGVALDRQAARARISALDAELTRIRHDIGALRTRISASVARERDSYSVRDSHGAREATHTPSSLGRWLAGTEPELGYIPDDLTPDDECPLTAAEFADLFALARELAPADRAEARTRLPEPARLPAPAECASESAQLHDIRDRLAGTESAVQDRITLERLDQAEVSALVDSAERAGKRLAQLEQPWLAAIRDELRNPSFARMWHDQADAIGAGISELAAWRNRTLGHSIALPEDEGLPSKEFIGQLGQLRDRLAAGKGVSRTFQRDLHAVRESCLVDEEPPRSAEDAELCLIEARSRRRRYELILRWNDAVARVGGPLLDSASPYPEYELAGHADGLSAALAWETAEWDALAARLSAAGVRAPQAPASADLGALAATLRTVALHVREKELSAWLAAVRAYLADGATQPRASILWTELLGAFDAAAWDRWGQAVDEVRRVTALTADVARFDGLIERLAAVAPVWAGRIGKSRGSGASVGDEGTALRAWEWRKADTWLRSITAADDPAVLQRQLEEKLRSAARVTGDLAAQSAWLGIAERLTDAERRALTAWVQALRKIGKGTGKYAAHWRSQAQQAMRDAQAAVPVWIMPAHRVVESFDPAATRFDVVIVDESSQCDLFGLAALAIADKAIIVGDDKQISPQAVGTEESAVHELILQHIPDLPQAGLLDIKSSLYDLAKMRFPGVIMLREHFRCLPEIIEFSNQLAYGGAILPLREQPADPSLRSVVDVCLADGFRDQADVNEAEADFIVGKIAELCEDERYEGKTFGVISFLGDGQAARIEQLLVERLGEKEVERREIRCGNAYHFQGDERDVIFVSLVVSPPARDATAGEGRRVGALTKESDRQRMNVAASRARDQLWCVRSIALDELHPDDVRSRLIRYAGSPASAARAARDAEPAPGSGFGSGPDFGSDFERDVYRDITARGYRVKTGYQVGRYRIDLVIEGDRGRLAVELDGDTYRGPDQWQAGRQRQAILARLGWTFHRLRGSAYYRDPGAALTPLWDRLESLGIRPARPAGGSASGPDDSEDVHADQSGGRALTRRALPGRCRFPGGWRCPGAGPTGSRSAPPG